MRKNNQVRLLSASILISASCLCAELPKAALNRDTPVDFATEIYPVLKANCLACHNSTKAKADLILESPQDMIKGGDSGPSIEVGNAGDSLLFITASHIDEPLMPPPNNKAKAKNLSPVELALLERWIDEGAKGGSVATPAPESWSLLTGPQPIYTSAITGDGRFAAVGRGQNIDLYDLRLGRFVGTLLDSSLEHPTAHRDIVQSLAFGSDGTLASGGFRNAKIWDRGILTASAPLILPQDQSATQVSPDGNFLSVGLKDGAIALFNLTGEPKPPVILKDHSGVVNDLAFSPDGKILFSVGADKTVKSRVLGEPDKTISLALPTAAQSVTSLNNGKQLLLGSSDQFLLICQADLKPFSEALPFVTFKLEAQPVVTVNTCDKAGTEFVVAYQNGLLIQLKINPADSTAIPTEVRRFNHGSPINQMATSGGRMATAGPSGAVKLWDLSTGKIIAEAAKSGNSERKMASLTRQVAVATRRKNYWNGKVAGEEKLWKTESEKAKTTGTEAAKASREKVAKRAAFEALQKQIPVAKDADIAKAEEELKKAAQAVVTVNRNREASTRLAGDAFSRQVAAEAHTTEADALIVAFQAEIETLKKEEAEAAKNFASVGISFSPDGTTLAVALKEGGLSLWCSRSGEWLEDISGVKSQGNLCYAGSEKVLISSENRKIIPWKLPGEKWTLTTTIGDGITAEPFADRVSALVFHPFEHQLVIGTGVPSRSGAISLWDTKTWEKLNENPMGHEDTITSIAFSPGGDQIVTGGTDRLVKIFDTDTLEHVQTFEGHTSHVLDVDWNADDLTLVSSSGDLQVKVWSIAENNQKSKVEGFQKEVSSVVFVADTESLLTASGDKSLKLANQPLPGAGTTFLHTAAVSADGKVIIAAGEDSILRVWDGTAKKLLNEFPSPNAGQGKVASD